MKLTPYIHFQGNAEEAMRFYAEALGESISDLKRYGENPMPAEKDYKDKILHGRLTFGDNLIMISDTMKGQQVPTNSNTQLSVRLRKLTGLTAFLIEWLKA